MPILPGGGGSSPVLNATTTVQNIIDGTAQDIRQQMSSAGSPGQAILIDYCNRVSLTLLRASRWTFLQSGPQRFVTQMGVGDYWIGAAGSAPTGVWDTGLNLTDLDRIKEDAVYDRSNFRALTKVEALPIAKNLSFSDASLRPGRPDVFRQDIQDTPNVLNIYPAPDNANLYQPEPDPPACETTSGGSLAGRIYYVRVTFVDSLGNESSAPGTAAKIFIPANFLITVLPPSDPALKSSTGVKYDRYNVYASTTLGSECLQTSNVSTGSNWTEPSSGLLTGTAIFPTANNVEPVDGYVIEFSYWKQRIALTNVSQVIQVPDVYKDVVIAGVNSFAFQYLNRPQESALWRQVFQAGIVGMIHDRNLYRSKDWMRPDPAAIGMGISQSVDPFDIPLF